MRITIMLIMLTMVVGFVRYGYAQEVVNGDFADGLNGWNVIGPATDGGGFALFTEDPVFARTVVEQQFVIPSGSVSLSFDYLMNSTYDGSSGALNPDYFTASLLDPVTYDPVLSTPGYTDFFFADNRGLTDYDSKIVNIAGPSVNLDLPTSLTGMSVLLTFEFFGGDDGYASAFHLDDVEVNRTLAIQWDNDLGNNDWYQAANWSGDNPPNDNVIRLINNGTPQTSSDVRISDGGSIKATSGDVSVSLGKLYVGQTNAGSFEISEGAMVNSNSVYLGHEVGSHGIATVTGSNSQWNSTQRMRIGYHGNGDLTISDGAVLNSAGGTLGRQDGATGNVVVTGLDSKWLCNQTLYIGNDGQGTLEITDGGAVESWEANIGRYVGSDGMATIEGDGSNWHIYQSLYIGGDSSAASNGGELRVANEGTVEIDETLHLWDNGILTVDGGYIRTYDFDLSHGGDLHFIGGEITVDGGSLITSEPDLVLSGTTGADRPTLRLVNGATADVDEWIIIGDTPYSDAMMEINSGAQVQPGKMIIGNLTDSSGELSVAGTGSTLTHRGMAIGWYGDGAALISGGGQITNTVWAGVGYQADSTGSMVVTGQGSNLTSPDFRVGSAGQGTISITNEGTATFDWCYIGGAIESLHHGEGVLTVADFGSLLDIQQRIFVGYDGTGTLNITDGGSVTSSGGYVANEAGSLGNVSVDGANSNWTVDGRIRVGYYGQGTVDITNGGQVSSMGTTIGRHVDSLGIVHVDGTNSRWDNTQTIYLGNYGQGQLDITNGAAVTSWDVNIGRYAGSQGTAAVSGTDSLWSVSGAMYVGGDESGPGGSGELTVEDEAAVRTTDVLKIWDTGTVNLNGGTLHVHSLDNASGGTFNFTEGDLIIDGGTAAITNIGTEDHSAGLELINGATMSVPNLYLGYAMDSFGSLVVDGPGSSLNVANSLDMGDWSSSGSLTVSNGATVSIGNLNQGEHGGSISVQGNSSHLSMNSFDGEGGTLDITEGATVDTGSAGLGGENSFHVTVEGAGSVWNVDRLSMYNVWREPSTVEVIEGGSMVSSEVVLGDYPNYGGKVTIDGEGSSWIVSGNISLAENGSRGELVVSNGGYVSAGNVTISLDAQSMYKDQGIMGSVSVDGSAPDGTPSTLNVGNILTVGAGGYMAYLTITNGGQVVSAESVIAPEDYSADVSVSGTGSTWYTAGAMDIGNDDDYPDGPSNVGVRDGGEIEVGGLLTVNDSAVLRVDGGSLVVQSISLESDSEFYLVDGTVTVDGGTWTQDADDDLVIAGADSGDLPTLKFINGATTNLNEWITIGDGAATNGALEILSGSNPAADKVRIGYMDQSNGTVIVDGNGSILTTRGLAVGWGGDASLTMTNGGQVAVNPVLGWGGVGYESTSNATVDISGAGSQLASWDFRIGVGGNGEMDINDQGSAEFTNLYVGGGPQDHHYGTGRLTVDGSGSHVLVSESMMVGYDGIGEMHITNGAVVNSMTSHIAYLTGSEGGVTVSGLGAVWENTAGMNVGGDGLAAGGNGSLTVAASGLVEVGGMLKVWSTGTLNIDGGTVYTRSLDVSDAGDFNFNYGRLTIDGGILTADSLNVSGIGDQVSEQAYMEVKNGSTVNLSGGLTVGSYSGGGELLITGGSQVYNSGSTYVGDDGSGSATVDGLGSLWDVSGFLVVGVGHDGSGGLSITNGAVVRSAGAWIGEEQAESGVLVSGAGSRWEISGCLIISDESYASLTVQDKGVVAAGGISTGSEGNSTITVAGYGSQLNLTGRFLIEDDTQAIISNGGELTSTGGYVGTDYGHSNVTVEGTNSKWINHGVFDVGISRYANSSSMRITDGGYVSNTDAGIAAFPNCTEHCYLEYGFGSVTVDGPTSTWMNTGTLTLGDPNSYGDVAEGDLSITNGGQVFNTNAYLAPRQDDDEGIIQGFVTVDGGGSQWNSSGSIYVGGDELGPGGEGSVVVSNSGQVIVDGVLKIWNSGQLSGDGLVTGNVDSDGIVTPGNSAGTLTIDGDYRQRTDGVLVIELADIDPLQNDLLAITGQADLTGTLQITLLDSFIPMPGDAFEIITADHVQGYFEQIIDNQETYPGLTFHQWITETGVTIKASALPGDANLDGQVGLLDLDILGRNWGGAGQWTEGDFSGGGEISLIDLDILGRHWGDSLQSIPEPSVLAVFGCSLLLKSMRKRAA